MLLVVVKPRGEATMIQHPSVVLILGVVSTASFSSLRVV